MYSTRRPFLFLASVYRSAGTQTVGNTNLNTRHREDNPFLHQNKISISTVNPCRVKTLERQIMQQVFGSKNTKGSKQDSSIAVINSENLTLCLALKTFFI
jgi:hypothetical protein